MNTFFYLSLLLAFLGVTLAETSEGNYSHPDYPGKCFFDEDHILSPGTHYNVYSCEEIICLENGYGYTFTCGSVSIDAPGCTLGKPKVPTYPGCCMPEVICPNDPDNNQE